MPSGKPDATIVGALFFNRNNDFEKGDSLDMRAFNKLLPTFTVKRKVQYNHAVIFRDNQTNELSWRPCFLTRRNGVYAPVFGLPLPRAGNWRERISNALEGVEVTSTLER